MYWPDRKRMSSSDQEKTTSQELHDLKSSRRSHSDTDSIFSIESKSTQSSTTSSNSTSSRNSRSTVNTLVGSSISGASEKTAIEQPSSSASSLHTKRNSRDSTLRQHIERQGTYTDSGRHSNDWLVEPVRDAVKKLWGSE
ncbi:hypothetical protein K402DRAFT_392284 [Aulographum hederae CBS 113979]|uniref:Uncharacterized protein n=1 Tax=Aulographum hederae CBS 113979 TaxID=1176131 RepID=A0A6G1H4P9_9PEZI|nr:hypothetical protein K402DRAFT_392284 [Aulographum hederae CBS 113979]